MEQKTKVFKISASRLQEGSYFNHFDCVWNDRTTVIDMERIAKSLAMETVLSSNPLTALSVI
jgi:hypothetical protein